MSNKTFKQDENKMGALFSKVSKAGKLYFTGFMGDEKIVAYTTKGKNKETGEEMTVINIYKHTELPESEKTGTNKSSKTKSKVELPF